MFKHPKAIPTIHSTASSTSIRPNSPISQVPPPPTLLPQSRTMSSEDSTLVPDTSPVTPVTPANLEVDSSAPAMQDELEAREAKAKEISREWARKYDEAQVRLGWEPLSVDDERYKRLKREFVERSLVRKEKEKEKEEEVVDVSGGADGVDADAIGAGVDVEEKKKGFWRAFGHVFCLGKH